jgi:hypothetical protein
MSTLGKSYPPHCGQMLKTMVTTLAQASTPLVHPPLHPSKLLSCTTLDQLCRSAWSTQQSKLTRLELSTSQMIYMNPTHTTAFPRTGPRWSMPFRLRQLKAKKF